MLTYGSFYSGIDAPLYALGDRVRSLFACEIDANCCKTLRANYSIERIHEGDVGKVDLAALPPVDVFVAGFPCQPYSRAGQQLGSLDSRAGGWVVCANYIELHRPRFVLLENVPQFRTSDDGVPLARLKQRISDAGYAYVQEGVYNALDHGSCQNRKRLFIVALRDSANFVPPVPHGNRPAFHELLDKTPRPEHKFISPARIAYLERRRASWGAAGTHDVETAMVAPTLCASHASNPFSHMIRMQDGRIREISPRECLRLMGFGDDFAICTAHQPTIRQAGNSIVVQMARTMLDAMLAAPAVISGAVFACAELAHCALWVVPECGRNRALLDAVPRPRVGTAQGSLAVGLINLDWRALDRRRHLCDVPHDRICVVVDVQHVGDDWTAIASRIARWCVVVNVDGTTKVVHLP